MDRIGKRTRKLAGILCVCVLATIGATASHSAYAADKILFENVTVIDGTGAAPIPNAYVLVDGDRISKVRRTPIKVKGAVERISGKGKYLIPGMMDVHIHLAGGARSLISDEKPNPEQGLRALQGYLYCGITTVLDLGNNPDYIFGMRDKERAGKIKSPHLLAAGGFVTATGGHGGSVKGSTLVDNWADGLPRLKKAIALHPDMLKMTYDEHGWGTRPMIPLLRLDLMQKIIELYNNHGIRTTVHTSNEYRARQAIFAGVDTLAHPVIQSPITENFARLMGVKKIPMASTLTIGEGYSRLVEHPEFLDQPLYQATFTPEEIKTLKTKTRAEYAKRGWTTWMKVMTPVAQENVRMIDAAGGVVALGSDQSNGPASHREIELMVSGGMSNMHAIRAATYNAAIFLGKERETGSIADGKIADLVLLDADPVADIANIKKIDMVVKAGHIIDRSKLDLLPVNSK